jgi:hypothetical protein
MKKPKRKRTAAEKRAKRERKRKYMTIFINGKQKRVPRPQLIEGLDVDEFIARNADPIWLHQNEMWELMPETLDTLDHESDLTWLREDELRELNTPDTLDTPDEADLIWLRENEFREPTTFDTPDVKPDAYDDDIPF